MAPEALVDDLVKTLELAGFQPTRDVTVDGHSVDVLLEEHAQRTGFICQEHESGRNINALIYDWYDTLRATNLDKVVLVLDGYDIAGEHREMAERYGIAIWSSRKLENLFDTAADEGEYAKSDILEAMQIIRDEMELLTFYRDRDGIEVEKEHGIGVQESVERVQNLDVVPEDEDRLPLAGFSDSDGNFIEFYRRSTVDIELRLHEDETGYDEAASLGDLEDSQIVELITRFMKKDFDRLKAYIEGARDIDEITSVTTILENLNTFRIRKTVQKLERQDRGAFALLYLEDSDLFIQCERQRNGMLLKYPITSSMMVEQRDEFEKLLASKGFEHVEKAGTSLLNEKEYMEDSAFLSADFGNEYDLLIQVVTDLFKHIFETIQDTEIHRSLKQDRQ
ncbi:MAG: hypothetical protein SVU32_02760 [Candidatus Nanohaloarchaea archaeon]|nr:hypothetical protein [Candidatus Nanohaloarchaea archaeon]